MMKRRYADYLPDDEGPSREDIKPPSEGPLPSRAWFERAETSSHGSWGMTVEHEMRYATNHQGEFWDLVTIAKDAGVTEFYVWSAGGRRLPPLQHRGRDRTPDVVSWS